MAHFKFTKKVIVEMAFCFLTITSLSVTTFAWFAMQNHASVSFMNMVVVDESIKVQMKYCKHNRYDDHSSSGDTVLKFPGYNDPREPVTTDDTLRKTITNYNTDFITIPGNNYEADGPLDIKNLKPGICHTFSFEISTSVSESRNIELRCGGFVSAGGPPSSPEGAKEARIKGTTTPIVLATAIDMYTTGVPLDSDNEVNTATANAFIKTNMLTGLADHFTYNEANETPSPNGYQLWTGAVAGNGGTELVLFTMEFTDLPATFYKYDSSDANYDYYVRDNTVTKGGSNAYNGLSFNITDLYINYID